MKTQTTALVPLGTCVSYQVEDPTTKLHLCNYCDYHRQRNKTKPWLEVKPKSKLTSSQVKGDLWSDYYSFKKPCCYTCISQGIKENEYKFCSQVKAPVEIYDEWGRKLLAVFEDVYACLVYNWVVYQGRVKTDKK